MLDLGEAWVYEVAFDPSSGRLAAAVEDRSGVPAEDFVKGFAVVWDPGSDREIGPRISTRGGSPIGVAWSPDGAQLAVIADNNVLHLHAAGGDREKTGEIESVDAPFLAAAFSPDGSKLATGTTAGLVQQWSASTRAPVGAALEGHTGPVGGVAYNHDGTLLATTTLGFSRTRLWDAETGASVGDELVGGRTPFTFSTFSDRALPGQPARVRS